MKSLLKRYLKMAMVLLPLAGMGGCNWLDVTPDAEVSIDRMFSKPEGFQNALLGVYTSMTHQSEKEARMYGQDMTYGFMDVLAQYYTVVDNKAHEYYYVSRMEYNNAQALDRVKAMWLGCYNSIANCNVLLDELSRKDAGFFEGHEYRLIKGEAYALRAYLHFDLFRMFALAWEKAKSSLTIPYVNDFSKQIHQQCTGEEVIRMALADLDSAANLLNGIDPVLESGYQLMRNHFDDPQIPDHVFLSYRGFRLNYYAVKALMARIHFYTGNQTAAFQYAEEVIAAKEAGFFQFTTQADFEKSEKDRDLQMYNELIFALDDATVTKRWFGVSKSDNTAFKVAKAAAIYSSGDFRLNLLKVDKSASLKYEDLEGAKNKKIPLLRLSEMYLIAAEAGYGINKSVAISRIEELKDNRGCSLNMDDYSFEALQQEVLAEARREFLGEGQLFYWYKRLQCPEILRGDQKVQMKPDHYILPLPATEVEFGDRFQPKA